MGGSFDGGQKDGVTLGKKKKEVSTLKWVSAGGRHNSYLLSHLPGTVGLAEKKEEEREKKEGEGGKALPAKNRLSY